MSVSGNGVSLLFPGTCDLRGLVCLSVCLSASSVKCLMFGFLFGILYGRNGAVRLWDVHARVAIPTIPEALCVGLTWGILRLIFLGRVVAEREISRSIPLDNL